MASSLSVYQKFCTISSPENDLTKKTEVPG